MPTHWDSQPHFTDEKIEAGREVEGDMAHATQLAIGGGGLFNCAFGYAPAV